MRLLHLAAILVICSSLAAQAHVASAALIMQMIDDFETPVGGVPFIGPTSAPAITTSGAGILGTRAFTTSSPLELGDAVAIGGGALQVFTGTTAMKSHLSYSFPSANFSGGGGIHMDFRSLDSGFGKTATTVDVKLITSSGDFLATTTVDDSAIPFTAILPFTNFTGAGDLGGVTGVEIILNDGGSPAGGTDFVLSGISVGQTVVNPEPSSFALWALAGIAALWQVNRSRQRKAMA